MTNTTPRKLFITVEGPLGIGKTELCKWLAKELNYDLYLEFLEGRVAYFRNMFYNNMKDYAFLFQMKLFQKRFRQHLQLILGQDERGAIQDRSIYGDKPFAYKLHQDGFITDDQLEIYEDTWLTFKQFLVPPDIMIFLKAETDTIMQRIKNRGRPEEQNIKPEYIETLNKEMDLLYLDQRERGINCWCYQWDDPEIRKNVLLGQIKKVETSIRSRFSKEGLMI